MDGMVAAIGGKALDKVVTTLEVSRGIYTSIFKFIFDRSMGRRAANKVLLKQIYFAGIEAFPIVSWTSLMIGLIIVTQIIGIVPMLGGEALIGKVLIWVVVRELGPLLSAVIVIARSGSAITSELGAMKIRGEIEALEMMGVDIRQYLVMPRVIGLGVSVFVLTFYFESVAILGGYLLAGFGKSLSFGVYITSVLSASGFNDYFASLLKSVSFGLIIGAVCCYHGLRVGRSITQIPQETTRAVMRSLLSIFLMDVIITVIFFI